MRRRTLRTAMAEQDEATPAAEERPAWRRTLARLLLVGGIALALTQVLPSVPHEQSLIFRLKDPAVQKLEATWTPEGEREALGGVVLSFGDAAPREVRHRVKLPNGRYEIAVDLERAEADSGLSSRSTTRRVNLDGDETVISLDPR